MTSNRPQWMRIGSAACDIGSPSERCEIAGFGKHTVRLRANGIIRHVPIDQVKRFAGRPRKKPTDKRSLVAKACSAAGLIRSELERLAECNGLSIEDAAEAILE